MEAFRKGSVVTLSDSSDDEQLPLLERILQSQRVKCKNELKSPISPKFVRTSSAHTMSDSEESDSEVKEGIDLCLKEECLLPNPNSVLPTFSSLQDCGATKPLLTLDIEISDNDEIEKTSVEAAKIIPKRNKKTPSKIAKNAKEEEKALKLKVREEKKKEKEFVKALKVSEKEILKAQKPEECIKNMKIVIDHNMLFQEESQAVFTVLDNSNLKYGIEENCIKFSVTWYRTVTDVTVENYQILKKESEKLENVLLLYISNEDFLQMVHASAQEAKGKNNEKLTLLDHIANIRSVFLEMDITCVIVGFNQYVRDLKEGKKNAEMKTLVKQVSKTTTEEVITEVQLQACVNFNFVNSMMELGNLLLRYTKAIAEAPHRKEKLAQKSIAFSWYADADSSCPAKIGKDGTGLIKLWQQQIQQFQNVSPEVAEAIVSRYQSPILLVKAYKNCSSIKDAEMLLQDIVVRRNYGPLGTQRRIGPELSFKIYHFFTSRDGNQILHR